MQHSHVSNRQSALQKKLKRRSYDAGCRNHDTESANDLVNASDDTVSDARSAIGEALENTMESPTPVSRIELEDDDLDLHNLKILNAALLEQRRHARKKKPGKQIGSTQECADVK